MSPTFDINGQQPNRVHKQALVHAYFTIPDSHYHLFAQQSHPDFGLLGAQLAERRGQAMRVVHCA